MPTESSSTTNTKFCTAGHQRYIVSLDCSSLEEALQKGSPAIQLIPAYGDTGMYLLKLHNFPTAIKDSFNSQPKLRKAHIDSAVSQAHEWVGKALIHNEHNPPA